MLKNSIKNWWLSEELDRFRSCEGGQLSIEFALMMPIYAFVLIGSFQFWDAFRSSSQTAKVAYTISDIASRHETFSTEKSDEIADVADKMLDFDLDQRRLRISNICFEDDRYTVQWSVAYKSSDITDDFLPIEEEDLLGADLQPLPFLPTMAPQESIILLELATRWQPIFNKPIFGIGLVNQTWSYELITRPRFVDTSVKHEELNDQTICPTVAEAEAAENEGGGGDQDGGAEPDDPDNVGTISDDTTDPDPT
ncbi:MAG: hypothetical protein AAGC81_01200 [Pseudomonadota bacterium]